MAGRKPRRRIWLILLGLLMLLASVIIVAGIGLAVAGLGQAPSSMSGFDGSVVVGLLLASLSLVGAVVAFMRAWRTPKTPSDA